MANRLIVHGKHRALPAAFETLARQTLDETAEVQALFTAAEFVTRWDASVATKRRVEIESAAVAATSAASESARLGLAKSDKGATVTASVDASSTAGGMG